MRYKNKNLIILLILLNYIIFTASYIPAAIKGNIYNILSIFVGQQYTTTGIDHNLKAKISLNLGGISSYGSVYSIQKQHVQEIKAPKANLNDAHVYPNPCRVYDGENEIHFTELTQTAKIQIFTISGKLVKTLEKDTYSKEIPWTLRNGQNQEVASGVYIYLIKNGSMTSKGKLVIIR